VVNRTGIDFQVATSHGGAPVHFGSHGVGVLTAFLRAPNQIYAEGGRTKISGKEGVDLISDNQGIVRIYGETTNGYTSLALVDQKNNKQTVPIGTNNGNVFYGNPGPDGDIYFQDRSGRNRAGQKGDDGQFWAVSASVGGSAENDPSASLQVQGTTKGFCPPRMTQSQRDAIVAPIGGLLIFNTDTNRLNLRTDAGWQVITSE
jgi:hypothetical protein